MAQTNQSWLSDPFTERLSSLIDESFDLLEKKQCGLFRYEDASLIPCLPVRVEKITDKDISFHERMKEAQKSLNKKRKEIDDLRNEIIELEGKLGQTYGYVWHRTEEEEIERDKEVQKIREKWKEVDALELEWKIDHDLQYNSDLEVLHWTNDLSNARRILIEKNDIYGSAFALGILLIWARHMNF